MPIHTLDRQKVRNELLRRGWKTDKYSNGWIRPIGLTSAQAEDDWISATLAGVECELEDRRIAGQKQRENKAAKLGGDLDTSR